MSGAAFITGLLIALILICLDSVTALIPAVCWVFAILFWGSWVILACSFLFAIIIGFLSRDFGTFSAIAGGGACLFLCGLSIALCIFVCAVFLDAARIILEILGLHDQVPITMERLFFPWKG